MSHNIVEFTTDEYVQMHTDNT